MQLDFKFQNKGVYTYFYQNIFLELKSVAFVWLYFLSWQKKIVIEKLFIVFVLYKTFFFVQNSKTSPCSYFRM